MGDGVPPEGGLNAQATVRGVQEICKRTSRIYYIGACVGGSAHGGWGVRSLGSGCGVDHAVLEAPAAQARITGPSRPTPLGRAQPQQPESLRSPPIGAASSSCFSARPQHPRSRGPACSTHQGGLPTRSCGSEASSFSPTAPRMIKILPRTGCVGLLRSRITCYFARDLVTSEQNKISNLTVIFS